MSYRTFRDVMVEKLEVWKRQTNKEVVPVLFQKWTGWKTPDSPVLIHSYLAAQHSRNTGLLELFIVRTYADGESESPWRDFFAFDHAGKITTLSELIYEISHHPDFSDTDFPLEVTEYDNLIANLTELVANDSRIRCRS